MYKIVMFHLSHTEMPFLLQFGKDLKKMLQEVVERLTSNIENPGLIIKTTPKKPANIAIQVLKLTCSFKIIADKATTNTGVKDAIE